MVTKFPRKRRKPEPLDVALSLSFRFGDQPEDKVQVMENRSIPMVGSVFEVRDKAVRGFALALVKAGLAQPKVLREIVPALGFLARRR